MLWSNASNGRAVTITVCSQDAAVCTRVKSEFSGARFTPQPTICEQFMPKAKSCSTGVTAMKNGCSLCLSVCLCVCSVSCPWMKLCDRPQHTAIGLAVLDHHNPCTPCLPAPYYVGGYHSAGKQDSNSCDSAFLTLHNVSSVCLSHHESRMSCCRSTISSSSISSKKIKLQNHIKPPCLEIRVSRELPACLPACLTSTTCSKLRGSSQSPV